MIAYLFICTTALLAALLTLKCVDHALTKQELNVALEMERQERQRRMVAEHVLNRINTAHLPPALMPLGVTGYTLNEMLAEL